jgi:hypothetical protein
MRTGAAGDTNNNGYGLGGGTVVAFDGDSYDWAGAGGGGHETAGGNTFSGSPMKAGAGGRGDSTFSEFYGAAGVGQFGGVKQRFYVAGGGGGGSGLQQGPGYVRTVGLGGLGGGGNGVGDDTGSSPTNSTPGTINTGGGGGGGGATGTTGSPVVRAASAGGSGVVIVRYAR